MKIVEYRIVLPMTVAEYQVAQLYCVAQSSLNETGGGDGVEVLKNEPFKNDEPLFDGLYTSGQYTHKIYHMSTKVPAFIAYLAPAGSLTFHETAWNAYPYCRTILKNGYMADKFESKFETMHVDTDIHLPNVHKLPPAVLEQRQVVYIDIADNSGISTSDYDESEDPTKFESSNSAARPLSGPKWWENYDGPVMCAYKLFTTSFVWWGLQTRVESLLQNQAKRLFTRFHRQLFCWQDNWRGMSMADLRLYEEEVKKLLEHRRQKEGLCGMTCSE